MRVFFFIFFLITNIAGAQSNRALFHDLLYNNSVTPPTPQNFTLTEIAYSANDLVAPLRAANTFYSFVQACPIPDDTNPWALDNEQRFTWYALNPNTAGVYNWSQLDAAINSSIDKNQKFSFGIMPIESASQNGITIGGGIMCYPVYVHNAMQAEAVKDWISPEGLWVPNWNSATYLASFRTFLSGIASHLASTVYKGVLYKNAISKIHVLGYGNWGEWHTAGAGRGSEPPGTKATAPSEISIVDAHLNAFPDYPLIGVVNAFCCESYPQVAYYILTVTNNWGELGWANYHLGSTQSFYSGYAENNTWVYNNVALKDLIMNKWQKAEITGEPMNNQAEVTLNGQVFGDLERQIRLYHISQFNNQTSYPAGTGNTTNLRASSKACGYRVSISSGQVSRSGTNMSLLLNWKNAGIAPVYENWTVQIQLVNSGGTVVWFGASGRILKYFQPGTATSTDSFIIPSLPTGAYSLRVKIIDPIGYRTPFVLYNTNRLADGSYVLTSINI